MRHVACQCQVGTTKIYLWPMTRCRKRVSAYSMRAQCSLDTIKFRRMVLRSFLHFRFKEHLLQAGFFGTPTATRTLIEVYLLPALSTMLGINSQARQVHAGITSMVRQPSVLTHGTSASSCLDSLSVLMSFIT